MRIDHALDLFHIGFDEVIEICKVLSFVEFPIGAGEVALLSSLSFFSGFFL